VTEIRPARPDDSFRLQQIEIAAGARFLDVGMPTVAQDAPLSVDSLTTYAVAGRSWVAVNDEHLPIGYAIVDVIEEFAHLEQISVHPDYQGRGIGRRLIDEIALWASKKGLVALILSTFNQVPWNAPLYEHLGFTVLDERALTEGLRSIRQRELAHGLDMKQRVFMRRDIPKTQAAASS
jgi:GNAT superfamily N-acetyltransferase